LEVRPDVDQERSTIDLELVPEVTEFEGFINYGSPILNRGVVVTDNVINYPVFSERKVNTRVTIYNGQTIVLGGLIREDVQKVNDKTPILGDIPFAGALFRSQADQHIKRNLVIFVTATLLDPSGQPLRDPATDMEFGAEDMPLDVTAASFLEPPLPQ
jgi:general secretion pathway protein D